MTGDNGHVSTSVGLVTPELRQLKSRVDRDEDVVNAAGARINDVFLLCTRLRKSGSRDPVSRIPDSVCSLAIKLEELRISAMRIKVDSLNATIAAVKKKVDTDRDKVRDMAIRLDSTKKGIANEREVLTTDYNSAYGALTTAVTHLEGIKMKRIHHQISSHTKSNLHVLFDIAFGKSPDVDMRLFDEPIIELRKFKDYKIQPLNRMLYNMIILQKYLSMVLSVLLPYLASLLELLPKFDVSVAEGTDEDEDFPIESRDDNVSGSTIRLGEATRLPLSSKTINYRRRESHRKLLRHDGELYHKLQKDDSEAQIDSSLPEAYPTGGQSPVSHSILEEEVREMTIPQLLTLLLVIARVFSNFLSFVPQKDQKSGIPGVSFRQVLASVRHIDVDLLESEPSALNAPIPNILAIKIYKAIVGNHPQDGMRNGCSDTDIHDELKKLVESHGP